MNKIKLLLPVIALAFVLAGCSTTPTISPALVTQGVAIGVSYSTAKYPDSVPYIRAASAVICSASHSTNISPAQVIAAVEASPVAEQLKTPQGVLILNAGMMLYIGVWESYGNNALNNQPELKLYLQATCSGLEQGLAGVPKGVSTWPLIRFK